jgi:hypothetical protein
LPLALNPLLKNWNKVWLQFMKDHFFDVLILVFQWNTDSTIFPIYFSNMPDSKIIILCLHLVINNNRLIIGLKKLTKYPFVEYKYWIFLILNLPNLVQTSAKVFVLDFDFPLNWLLLFILTNRFHSIFFQSGNFLKAYLFCRS